MNELDAERLIELEEMIKNDNIIYPINYNEYLYLELARKMPIDKMIIFINFYKKSWYFIGETQFTNTLKVVFNCTDDELTNRFITVNKILKYKNKLNSRLLKEQKQMIKRMKK